MEMRDWLLVAFETRYVIEKFCPHVEGCVTHAVMTAPSVARRRIIPYFGLWLCALYAISPPALILSVELNSLRSVTAVVVFQTLMM